MVPSMVQIILLVSDKNTLNHIIVSKLFVIRIFNLSYDCLKTIIVIIILACVKNFFQMSKVYQVICDEFKNTIYSVWSGLAFKICMNTSQQTIHNDNTYSKACGLYLSQLNVGARCLV